MKKNLILLALVGLCGSVIFTACKKDDDDDNNSSTKKETVADNNTFKNWNTWTLNDTRMGPDPALGAMAHGGQDSMFTRKIYIKDGNTLSNGNFPDGTTIVKHSENSDGSVKEYTAMVKRAGNYNSSKGGWEYFMINEDGSIRLDSSGTEMRGAELLNGFCQGCHAKASGKDYVFTAK